MMPIVDLQNKTVLSIANNTLAQFCQTEADLRYQTTVAPVHNSKRPDLTEREISSSRCEPWARPTGGYVGCAVGAST